MNSAQIIWFEVFNDYLEFGTETETLLIDAISLCLKYVDIANLLIYEDFLQFVLTNDLTDQR